MVQGQGVGEGLAGGLDGEVVLVVPDGVPGKGIINPKVEFEKLFQL